MDNSGTELLSYILSLVKQDEHETRQHILDGAAGRREWRLHRQRCTALECEARFIFKHLVTIEAVKPVHVTRIDEVPPTYEWFERHINAASIEVASWPSWKSRK